MCFVVFLSLSFFVRFSLVGRKVKLGDFFGVVSQYKPLEDSFDIQFEVGM